MTAEALRLYAFAIDLFDYSIDDLKQKELLQQLCLLYSSKSNSEVRQFKKPVTSDGLLRHIYITLNEFFNADIMHINNKILLYMHSGEKFEFLVNQIA